ncbi:hypothetical protein MTO96_032093 [Rhipicephalus appendiculatus]
MITEWCSIAPDYFVITSANRSRISAIDPFQIVTADVEAGVSSIESIMTSVGTGGGALSALSFACPNTGFCTGAGDVLS